MSDVYQPILSWAKPFTLNHNQVVEGQRFGWLPDHVVTALARQLKREYKAVNQQIAAEPRRGYEIELADGYVVGINRKWHNYGPDRPWYAYCRIKPKSLCRGAKLNTQEVLV